MTSTQQYGHYHRALSMVGDDGLYLPCGTSDFTVLLYACEGQFRLAQPATASTTFVSKSRILLATCLEFQSTLERSQVRGHRLGTVVQQLLLIRVRYTPWSSSARWGSALPPSLPSVVVFHRIATPAKRRVPRSFVFRTGK